MREAASAGQPVLSIENLTTSFRTQRGTVYAVNGTSFDIRPGETLGIVGESGCGKSVTSLALLGILPRAGTSTRSTASRSTSRRARRSASSASRDAARA